MNNRDFEHFLSSLYFAYAQAVGDALTHTKFEMRFENKENG